MINSILNISNETSSRKIENDIFKTVVDRSPITFNPKYEKTLEIPVKCKHIITINDFPKMKFGDSEKRRYILLRTVKSIPGNQRTTKYKEDFIQNRIYLLNYMLRGIDKLIDNNFRIEYQDSELVDEMIELSDTIVPFVESYLVYSEGNRVNVTDIFKEFLDWKEYKRYINDMSLPTLMGRIYQILDVKDEYTGYEKKREYRPGTRIHRQKDTYLVNIKLNIPESLRY